MNAPRRPRAVVIGGGIAGLAAAHFLSEEYHVVVLEAADRVGGKLRRDEVAGTLVDTGAEAMLNRRPEGVDLAASLGLDVVHPALAASRIWSRGELRRLPRSLMGVPADLDDLAETGLLSAEGLARVRREPGLEPYELEGDPTVRHLIADRLGEELVDRLVEPLLGGVYAGHAHLLSARAATPQVVAMATRGSLLEQAGVAPIAGDRPVFAGIPGGMGLLAQALAATGRFEVRTGSTVSGVEPCAPEVESVETAPRFRVVVGPTTSPEAITADRVVLATPAAATARLLRNLAPRAATELAEIESASVAVATLGYRRSDLPAIVHGCSGFLVPPMEGKAIKAATFSVTKWAWLDEAGRRAGDVAFLRTSLGRHREEASLQCPDGELVRRSRDDLREAIGLEATPVDAHVQRWGGGLPQYLPGHVDRVARIRAAVAEVPGVSVCGAAYDGVGIPAVIGSALRATMES